MNITLVTIHSGDPTRSVSLAAAAIASYAKARSTLSLAFTLLSFGPEEPAEKIAAAITKTAPDVAGFSVYSWCSEAALKAAALVGEMSPAVFLVSGGPQVTGNPASFLPPGPFDAAVSGEGEAAFLSIIEAHERQGFDGKKTETALASHSLDGISTEASPSATIAESQDLGTSPSPWLSGFLEPVAGDSVLWETARGCPFRCAYCFESKGSKKVRTIPRQRLIDELTLFAKAGVAQVHVLDPAFNSSPERADALLDLIAEYAPGIYFAFEARAETVTEGTAERLAETFCSVQIGLQSSNPDALSAVDRPFDRKKFLKGIEILNEHGAVFGFDLIYGLPRDSLAGFRASVDFAVSLWPNHLDVFPLEIIEGTRLAETAASFGLETAPGPRKFVTAHPSFPLEAVEEASKIADGINLLYNRGKTVPWFNQFLHASKLKPWQAFLDFERRMNSPERKTSELKDADLRREILAFVAEKLSKAGRSKAIGIESDIARLGFAMADAVTGTQTVPPLTPGLSVLELSFDPEDLLEAGAYDLEVLVANLKPGKYLTAVWNGESGIRCEPIRRDLWDWLEKALGGKVPRNAELEKRAKELGMTLG